MRIHRLFTVAILTGVIPCVSVATYAFQRGGGQSRGNAPQPSPQQSRQATPPPPRAVQQPRQARTTPQGGAAPFRQTPAPPVHAQREVVRTPNFVPRTTGGTPRPSAPARIPERTASPARTQERPATPERTQERPVTPERTIQPGERNDHLSHQITPRRPIVPNAPAIQGQRKFTKTPSGRIYDNGLTLRKGMPVSASWQRHYFPKGRAHFPFYRNTFVRGQSFRSPFSFYFGVCVPYIAASECHVYPPAVVFVDIPVFNGVQFTRFDDADDQNLFNDPNLNQEQPGLLNAIDYLTEAFQGGNIDGLVTLIDPNTSIAVYLNGHYQYSLSANDYIDLSRDAIQSMHTVGFTLNSLHQRAPNVFSVAGKQTYQDQNGQTLTTWVSFVLQDISGQWTLTQVGTAPGRKQ